LSLRDEAAAAHPRRKPGPKPTIARLVDLLEGDERDEVVALVWDEDHELSYEAIARTLTKHYGNRVGRITAQQVGNHRRSEPRPS
jgi:hypothetical protein